MQKTTAKKSLKVSWLKQIWAVLNEPVTLSATSATYDSLRYRFMRNRLRWAMVLGLIYFLSFVPIDLYSWLVQDQLIARTWLLTGLTRIFGLAICLIALQFPLGHRRLGILFVGASWSVILIRQIVKTVTGNVTPDDFDWTMFTWTMVFFSQATLIPVRWPLHLISQLGALIYYFGVNPLLGFAVVPAEESPASLILKLFWMCAIPNLSIYLYEHLAEAEFDAQSKLKVEQERSERLLLNILPQPIAERLKQEERTIADSFREVTVLFADIVGFTKLSEQIPPTQLVELLNQTFSIFDRLAEKYGLEKIKTIGDAYMVAGLPEPHPDYVCAVADMALDMQQALQAFNQHAQQNLKIRIGIHTGPVVAGVIGMKKFAYDLWGDTVNTASRMESHSLPGKIQVSQTTYECLRDRYEFEARGAIPIKGKGEMSTYFLKGRRSS